MKSVQIIEKKRYELKLSRQLNAFSFSRPDNQDVIVFPSTKPHKHNSIVLDMLNNGNYIWISK